MVKDTIDVNICGRVKTFQSYPAWARRQRNGGRSDARDIYDAVHAKSVERYKVRYNCSSLPFNNVEEYDKVVVDNDTLIAAMDMPLETKTEIQPKTENGVVSPGGMGLGMVLIACAVALWYLLLGRKK